MPFPTVRYKQFCKIDLYYCRKCSFLDGHSTHVKNESDTMLSAVLIFWILLFSIVISRLDIKLLVSLSKDVLIQTNEHESLLVLL